MITLLIISAVVPITSVAIGIGILGETPRTGVLGGIAAGAAVLVASLALACLARLAPPPEAPRPSVQPVPSPRLMPPAVPEPVSGPDAEPDRDLEPALAGCGSS
jgi:hypothetical protein